MKHTCISNVNQELIYAFSSETTWLWLNKGDIVESEGQIYEVMSRLFIIEEDKLIIYVRAK